jgi:hypothetical protein
MKRVNNSITNKIVKVLYVIFWLSGISSGMFLMAIPDIAKVLLKSTHPYQACIEEASND